MLSNRFGFWMDLVLSKVFLLVLGSCRCYRYLIFGIDMKDGFWIGGVVFRYSSFYISRICNFFSYWDWYIIFKIFIQRSYIRFKGIKLINWGRGIYEGCDLQRVWVLDWSEIGFGVWVVDCLEGILLIGGCEFLFRGIVIFKDFVGWRCIYEIGDCFYIYYYGFLRLGSWGVGWLTVMVLLLKLKINTSFFSSCWGGLRKYFVWNWGRESSYL